MRSQTKKLITSAFLCLCGILAAEFWYQWDYKHSLSDDGDTKIKLAELKDFSNVVQKKAPRKLVWRHAQLNDSLFSGESVRTVADSSASIVFSNGAVIDLEADSVVAIEETESKVNIDFIKGNLFVKGMKDGETGSDVEIKSGETKINLKDVEMAIGKSAGKRVDVQVFRGVAEVETKGKKVTLDKNKQGTISGSEVNLTEKLFKNLSPDPNSEVYIRADQNDLMTFTFSPLTADYEVQLFTGPQREKLNPTSLRVPGPVGRISAHVPPGNLFWKLEARKQNKVAATSPTLRTKVVAESAPQPTWPTASELVALSNSEEPSVTMRWVNPSKLKALTLQVASDSQFKNLIFNGVVEEADFYALRFEKDGVYFWRLSGVSFKDSKTMLTGATQRFTLQTKIELIPPKPISPANQSVFNFETVVKEGMKFEWNKISGMEKYVLHVESQVSKENSFEREFSDLTSFKTSDMAPGTYKWTLISIDGSGKRSEASQPWQFTIGSMPKLEWTDGKTKETYFYATKKPTMALKWQAYNSANPKYRLTISGMSLKEPLIYTESKSEKIVEVPFDGEYEVKVEALSSTGVVLARSEGRLMNVGLKALLPPPAFSSRMPSSLEATKNGSVTISWNAVSKARSYFVTVISSEGKTVRKNSLERNQAQLRGLLPGQYKVAVSSVDEFEREGPLGEARPFSVPETSDIKTPGFKKIKVK